MITTIETDSQSPFCDPEVPAAEWTWRNVLTEACGKGPAYLRAWCAKANVSAIPDYPTVPSGRTVNVFVNHGRWMWKCPDCQEAQVASNDDRRAFCCGCFNGGAGYHTVCWPGDLERIQIEVLLGQRPVVNRNWWPHESVDQLQIENIALGLPTNAPCLATSRYEIALPLVRTALADNQRRELG